MVETAAADDGDDAAAVAVIAVAYHAAAPAVIPSCCPCGCLCCTIAHCRVAVALLHIKNTPSRSWVRSLAALAVAVGAAADGALAAHAVAVETFAAAGCLSPCCYPNAATRC